MQARPNPRTPRELGVPPSRDTTARHPPRPGWAHWETLTRGPRRRPPLRLRFPLSCARPAPRAGASALALSTRSGNFLPAAAGSLQTSSPSREHAARLSAPRIFFFRLLGFLRSLSVWIRSQPGADSSRRGGRRRLGRVAGPSSRPGGRNCADGAPGLHRGGGRRRGRRAPGEGSPEPLPREGRTQLPYRGVSLRLAPQYFADGRMNGRWKMEAGRTWVAAFRSLLAPSGAPLPPPKRKATREFCSFPRRF